MALITLPHIGNIGARGSFWKAGKQAWARLVSRWDKICGAMLLAGFLFKIHGVSDVVGEWPVVLVSSFLIAFFIALAFFPEMWEQ